MKPVEVIETSTTKDAKTTVDSSKESVKLNEDNQKVEAVQESKTSASQEPKESQNTQQTQTRELVKADADIPQTGHESMVPAYMLGMSTMFFLLTMIAVVRKRLKLGVENGK